ncbi:MAG: SPOR domain-containing protein [bacterium]|nr:SPOR domain-containing protein [bacterium]
MAEGSRSQKRAASPNWLASLMGAVFLISAGFMFGLVVGVVKEEPDLVMGHLAGQSEEVLWSEQEAQSAPDVAAPGPYLDAPEDTAGLQGETFAAAAAEEVPVAAAEDVASQAYVAAPSDPPTPAPRREAAARVGFSVQVGAFAESGSAERIASDLRAKGYPAYVTPSAGSEDGRWRVRVGPMSSRSEADDAAAQLKTRERLPTWVLSEGGG